MREKLIELIMQADSKCFNRECEDCEYKGLSNCDSILTADYLIENGVEMLVKKPVTGYEGYYEVDQFGTIYSVARTIEVNDNGRIYNKPVKARVMKQTLHTGGYKTVGLTKDGKSKNEYVHRIVATAFIPNEESLPMVNHKDEDKTNNYACNLEWCTNEYNLSYGSARERRSEKLRGKKLSEEHKKKLSDSLKKTFRKNAKVKFEYDGEMLSIPELSERLNIPQGTLWMRYRRTGNVFKDSDYCNYGEPKEKGEE